MQKLIEVVGILVFLGAVSLARWWIAKQQRAQAQAAERSPAPPPAPPSADSPAKPDRRTLFYGRTPQAPPPAEARPPDAPRPAASPQVIHVAQQVRRRAQPQPAAAPRPQATRLGKVGALGKHHLRALKGIKVSALRDRRLSSDMTTQLQSSVPSAGGPKAQARPHFLGGMLRGRNVAKAFVMSEVLGPPKGLQGP